MTTRPTKRWGAALAAVLLVAACGSDDEGAGDESSVDAEQAEDDRGDTETTAEPAEDDGGDDGAEVTPPPVDEAADDDGDTIVIDDFDDIPGECVDLMAEFLRDIEGEVSVVDWETATIDDLEAMGDMLDVASGDFEARLTETGCDRYDIGTDDDQSLEFAMEVAEREAPGAVGWLEFVASISALGDTVDDATGIDEDGGGETGSAGPDGDLPTDCEGTKSYLLDQAEEYGTIQNVPVSEFPNLMMAVQNLTVQCTLADAAAFSEDPTITAFLDGG